MKNVEEPRAFKNRFVIAIFAGLLLAMAFPRIGIAGLAWIAPGLLAAASKGKSGWESFRIGYVGGLAYYLVTLGWLLRIPYRWHGIPIGPAFGLLALSAFLALYPGIWVWFLSEIHRPESLPRNEESVPTNLPRIFSRAEGAPPMSPFWRHRFGWALSGAAAWVAIEMCIARFLSGFPWDLLGVSQYGLVPLIQIASITGVYGVSFMVIWASLSLLLASVAVLRRPTLRHAWMGEIIVPLGALVALFLFGFSQTRSIEEPSRKLKVTFVQPSIPQELIWD